MQRRKPSRPLRSSKLRRLARSAVGGGYIPPRPALVRALALALRRALGVLRALLLRAATGRFDATAPWADRVRAAFAGYVATTLRAEVKRIGQAIFGASKAAWEAARKIPRIAAASIVPGGQRAIDRFVQRNTNLIVTVGDREIRKVENMLHAEPGLHVKALQARLQEETGVDEARAELWARDQTLKLHGQIHEAQALAAGMQRYRWTGADDEREREDHKILNNKIFLFGQPPVTNASEVIRGKAPRRGNPGSDYQCRCTVEPIPDDESPELQPVTFDGFAFRKAKWTPGIPAAPDE